MGVSIWGYLSDLDCGIIRCRASGSESVNVKTEIRKVCRMADKEGLEFLASIRGQMLMAQALYVAIDTLEKVKPYMREDSNIADMKFLQETVFTFPTEAFEPTVLSQFGKL
jgi:hypothetical protein|tara:strand:+ start:1308 stop:1640 length:333 start_codon:yes stop_codon:yes gene_type:complete